MDACWSHSPSNRPSLSDLVTMLTDTKPEQVQVVVSGIRSGGGGMMKYKVGDVITVLDRSNTSGDLNFWTEVGGHRKVGWSVPSHTVTYLGNLPSSSSTGAISRETRKGSNRKISCDII